VWPPAEVVVVLDVGVAAAADDRPAPRVTHITVPPAMATTATTPVTTIATIATDPRRCALAPLTAASVESGVGRSMGARNGAPHFAQKSRFGSLDVPQCPHRKPPTADSPFPYPSQQA
jgi:hypothetical protein